MASLFSVFQSRRASLFLNISFLFLVSFYLAIDIPLSPPRSHLQSASSISKSLKITYPSRPSANSTADCAYLKEIHDIKSKCEFVKSGDGCQSDGYVNYLQLFYCNCGEYPVLGYTVLALWLLVLFYLLGNTAAYYFCSSLEELSTLLKLSPALAGVTLLSLGNGAPDVFSSIVSFLGPGSGTIGLNSVLGGVFFVSSVVVGVISIAVGRRGVTVEKSSFIRDVCFLLLSLSFLLAILLLGRVNIWAAIGFTSIYVFYVFVVSSAHFCVENFRRVNRFLVSTLTPDGQSLSEYQSAEYGELDQPLFITVEKGGGELQGDDRIVKTDFSCFRSSRFCYYSQRVFYLLELPLYLPRRLTIPVVCEEKWSKPFAVASVTLAPILLATLWNRHGGNEGPKQNLLVYLVGGIIGTSFGVTAVLTTDKSSPPKKFLFPWLAGGFLMSVIWTYITADELVSLLVSLGHILGISPSVLGLTVLAWGNSLGDLIANAAMAMNGGSAGAQVAISGCYAGPLFNTLVGLGSSLVLAAWSVYPSPFLLPSDPSLYQTLGFLVGGLLWALVMLPRKEMRLDRFLGAGLLAIYLCFLSLSLARALGFLQFHGSH